MSTAICFDLDGTLVRYDRPYDDVLAETFETHLGAATDETRDAYEAAFFEGFAAFDPEPYRAGLAAAAEYADADDVDLDAMVETLRETEYAACTVPEATRECLADLAADGETSLALVTDGVGDWQREKLSRLGLAERFDETVVSYDVGGHKTDGAPYEAVRERIDADEYVMVGDDYEADVEAARAAGFVPVHYADAETDLFAILRAML